jgi:hypothetical protein
MASVNKNFDSVGGFSVSDKTLINELYDVKNANSVEIKNSFYGDSTTSNYILRGLNTAILQLDNVGSQIPIQDSTVSFITGHILAVNPAGSVYSAKIESALYCNGIGATTVLSSMLTIIKDDIPSGETWDIEPFGGTNQFSYTTTRAGTVQNIKWAASTQVVSIEWA